MRTMYDSVNPAAIPADAQLVAGYVDGRYVWTAEAWNRFPSAVQVTIAVFPDTNAGVVLDVERGNATPDQAPGWVMRRRAAGVDPSVYCTLYAWPAVRQAFAAAGVPEPHYWIAHWDAVSDLPDGAVAKQYAADLGDGWHYDTSAVADYWPGVDSAPVPTPPPAPAPPPPVPAPYVVQSGDTLSAIAQRYGTTWQALWDVNRGVIGGDPNVIYPGQQLMIPNGAGAVYAPVYTVQSGDTLSGIAAQYGTTWQAIYETNRAVIGDDPNVIYPGQQLVIPS